VFTADGDIIDAHLGIAATTDQRLVLVDREDLAQIEPRQDREHRPVRQRRGRDDDLKPPLGHHVFFVKIGIRARW
jgi:hypothetical protein